MFGWRNWARERKKTFSPNQRTRIGLLFAKSVLYLVDVLHIQPSIPTSGNLVFTVLEDLYQNISDLRHLPCSFSFIQHILLSAQYVTIMVLNTRKQPYFTEDSHSLKTLANGEMGRRKSWCWVWSCWTSEFNEISLSLIF